MNAKTSAPATIAAQALGWIEPTARAVVPPDRGGRERLGAGLAAA